MRILVATDQWYPDFQGGAARVATETARQLSLRGHELTVLAPSAGTKQDERFGGNLTVLRRLPRGAAPQTITDVVCSRALAKKLDVGYDLVVAHQVTMACGLAAAQPRLPLALVYHGSSVREARLDAEERPFGPRRAGRTATAALLTLLERIAVRRARRVIVLSEYMAALVADDFPAAADRISVARGGVDSSWIATGSDYETARGSLGILPRETVVLAVRRLERGLGLERLLQAFRLLAETRDATFVVLGRGSLAPRLCALGNDLGLGDRLRLPGAAEGEALRRWYRAADLFVLPPKRLEGFGMATVEALASGTPVVAAAVGANPELLRPLDARLLAPSDEPSDLAAAMSTTLTIVGPDLRQHCREYASNRFSWDRVIGDWEDALLRTADCGF